MMFCFDVITIIDFVDYNTKGGEDNKIIRRLLMTMFIHDTAWIRCMNFDLLLLENMTHIFYENVNF